MGFAKAFLAAAVGLPLILGPLLPANKVFFGEQEETRLEEDLWPGGEDRLPRFRGFTS